MERPDERIAAFRDELLRAERLPAEGVERERHVGLTRTEPDVAEEDARDLAFLGAALRRDLRGLPVRLLRGDLHRPALVFADDGFADLLAVQGDLDGLALLAEAPHRNIDITLQDHVVRAHVRDLKRGGQNQR